MIKLLSRVEVCERLGVTYVTVWNWMRKGQFPRGINVSDGVVRWPEPEVEEWLKSRPRQRLKGDEA